MTSGPNDARWNLASRAVVLASAVVALVGARPYAGGWNDGSRLAARDAELCCEPDRGDAVDDAEIDRLGAAPYRRVHVFDRHAEHLARCHGMDVEPVGESLAQRRRVGHMGEHA